MNKIINVVLQLILVVVVAGVAFIMQGADSNGALSNGQMGILVLSIPFCWVVLRFFKSVWFYFAAIVLALGFFGGYLSVNMDSDLSLKLSEQSLSGYAIVLFALFLFCGAAMVCFSQKLGLFFIRALKMPLAAWVLLALLIDFALELLFYEQSFCLVLLQLKVTALLSGLAIGLISKITSSAVCKVTGSGLEAICFVGYSSLSEDVEVAEAPVEAPPASVATPSARPGMRPRVPSRPAGGPKAAIPKIGGGAPKTSVLDAKLEALCAPGPKKKRGDSSSNDAPVADAAESVPPEVPKTTETGKIVSSVDFG